MLDLRPWEIGIGGLSLYLLLRRTPLRQELLRRRRGKAGSSNGKQRKQLAYLEAAVALGCR